MSIKPQIFVRYNWIEKCHSNIFCLSCLVSLMHGEKKYRPQFCFITFFQSPSFCVDRCGKWPQWRRLVFHTCSFLPECFGSFRWFRTFHILPPSLLIYCFLLFICHSSAKKRDSDVSFYTSFFIFFSRFVDIVMGKGDGRCKQMTKDVRHVSRVAWVCVSRLSWIRIRQNDCDYKNRFVMWAFLFQLNW